MKKVISFVLISFLFLFIPKLSFAQESGGLNPVTGYEVTDKDAIDGDILIFTDQGLKRADTAFAQNIFGVLNKQAIISIETGSANEQPVTSSGTVTVNVTTAAGPIKKGDKITTSTIPGKGEKAIGSGLTLGIALADYNEAQGKVGQIPVVITKEYIGSANAAGFSSQLFSALGTAIFQNIQDPKNFGQVLRFITAGMAVLAGFVTSFLLFSKTVPKSIDAVGRNPLAQKSIYFVTWMNIALAIVVTLIGVGAAYLIIKL